MNKHEYLLRFHRFQRSREKHFAPKIAKALINQYRTVTDNIERGFAAVDLISSEEIMRILRNIYMDAAITYGAKVRADFVRNKLPVKSYGQKARMPMGFSEQMAQLIAQYFRTDILNTSEDITATTKNLIKKVFTEAYEKGLSLDELVAQLKDTELSKVRARLIARTETVTSANKGAMFVAKDTGLELNKEWLSAKDSRVRLHHRNENGLVIPMDEFFTVGPDLMQYPGDRGGHDGAPVVSAGNVVNCRCTILHIPIDDVRTIPKPVTPAKFTPAKTITEAEDFAIKSGLTKEVSYKDVDVDVANSFNKVFFEQKQKYDLRVLDSIKVVENMQGSNPKALASFISYRGDPEINVEISKHGLQKIKETGYEEYFNKLKGSYEMVNIEGMAKHEAIHYLQRTKMTGFNDNELIHEAFRAGELLQSSGSLSLYSRNNMAEFMAELGTAKFHGKQLNDIYTLNRDTKPQYDIIKKLWDLL